MEYWTTLSHGDPRDGAAQAARLEADGWDGVVMYDSQCMFPEVWTSLALCANATTRIKLATGVTNPITRHPSVTAAAAASIQLMSEGRAVLGVGRGDSALAYVGASPMPIGKFEHYLNILQTYLRGEDVPMEDASAMVAGANVGFKNLAIGAGPSGSRLKWLDDFHMPKVPLEAFATGPKAIESAARTADRVVLGLAAETNRLRWGIDLARSAARAAGRDDVGVGAVVQVVPHHDVDIARRLAGPTVASMARFSVMNHKVLGPTTERQAEIMLKIAEVYDMNKHGKGAAAQTDALDAEFIDQFGIVGTAETCVARLRELESLGLDRITVSVPPIQDPELEVSYEILRNEVLPQVTSRVA